MTIKGAYNKNKKHVYNWRMRHPAAFAEAKKIYNRRFCEWKRITSVFRKILIDETY